MSIAIVQTKPKGLDLKLSFFSRKKTTSIALSVNPLGFDNVERTFYIVAGASGLGKTEFSRKFLLNNDKIEFLNSDEIAKEINPNSPSKCRISASRELLKKLQGVFEEQKSAILETTLAGGSQESIIKRAKEQGYKTIFVYLFGKDIRTCKKRIQKRINHGGHDVPEEDLIRRFHRSNLNFGFCRKMVDECIVFYSAKNKFIRVLESCENGITLFKKNFFSKFVKYLRAR